MTFLVIALEIPGESHVRLKKRIYSLTGIADDQESTQMFEGNNFTQETIGGWLVVTRAKPKSMFTLSDTQELFSLDTPSGKPWARLAFLDGARGVSKEAREYLKIVPNRPGLCCLAVILKSPVANVIGNFFLSLDIVTYPRKLFDSEGMAMEWIKGMMAKPGTTIV